MVKRRETQRVNKIGQLQLPWGTPQFRLKLSEVLSPTYGTRFTKEDGQALKLLTTFLGKESKEYMILILTWGDQAKVHAEEESITPEECISQWIETLPEWVQEFVNDKKRRVVLFDNRLKEEENPDAFKQQLSHLIKVGLKYL